VPSQYAGVRAAQLSRQIPQVTYLQAFRHVAMRAMLALILWSLLICAAIGLLGHLSGSLGASGLDNLLVVFGASFIVGYLVLMIFAVPIYTWCSRFGRVWWPYVVLIGAAPGLAVLLIRVSWLGFLLIVSGVVVATVTHLMVARDFAAGSNTSLGRTHER
jgi:hypothetical protein